MYSSWRSGKYLQLIVQLIANKTTSISLSINQHNIILFINDNVNIRLKNSEYDQEIPQSQTADNPVAPRGRAAQPTGRQIKQSNQLSLPHQDDCNTRTDTKQRTTKHRTITDSHNGSNNKQKVTNNRTTALERAAA